MYDDSHILRLVIILLGFDVYMHNVHRKLIDENAETDFSYTEHLVDTLCLAKALKRELAR